MTDEQWTDPVVPVVDPTPDLEPTPEPDPVDPPVPTEDVGKVPGLPAPIGPGSTVRALFVDEVGATHALDVVLIALWPYGVEWTPADDKGQTLTPWHSVVSLDVL